MTVLPTTPHMGINVDLSPVDVSDYEINIGRTPESRPRMSGAQWITEAIRALAANFGFCAKALVCTFKFDSM